MNTYKFISTGILLLFAGFCFFPIGTCKIVVTNHQMNSVGNVIIVDNEGDGDYTSIKEAIENVSNGRPAVVDIKGERQVESVY